MDAKIALRHKAAAAADLVDLLVLTGNTLDARSDAAAIGFHPNGPYFDPVMVFGRITTQQRRRLIDVGNEDVHIPIIVEVPKGAAAAHGRVQYAGSDLGRDIFEAPISQIPIDHSSLPKRDIVPTELFDLRVNVTVAFENIRPAIVIKIGKSASPTEQLETCPCSSMAGQVRERTVPVVMVQVR